MPSANAELIKLLDAMGGRQAAVDAINGAKDAARDESVTLRQLQGWVYADVVPPLGRFYLLAGACYLGISPLRAISLFEDLEPTARMVGVVTGQDADELEDEDAAA